MSSAWDYSANERSADGKFSADFEGHEIAHGHAEFGRATALRERRGAGFKFEAQRKLEREQKRKIFSQSGEIEQILLSEQATACFTFSDDSRFLAFAQ